ncbi:AAA family ATPase [Tissierella carlieri]|uniref:AAA family ATPase n=1 Tax=Tissierella carlieri TaxID=689904 RepID=UPI001C0F8C19|nr:AAA family ATPase [Tissierella carlieri]MBU5312814.1 AAA family ATPase [Tissierella carlieri]
MEKLLDKIIEKRTLQKNLIIGIDGLGGAGKTTIVNSLKSQLSNRDYNTVILHIDDFIHPKNIRYNESKEEWYCYYNIQWRYDYLIKEILMAVKEGIEIDKEIEIYDKDNDIYTLEQIKISQGSIILLEGIFLQRKEIREYFDYVIYLDVPKEVRLNRVMNRDKYMGNSEEIKLKYERRYFPAEDKYIEEYSPIQNADYVLNYVRKEEENIYML